MTRIEKEQIDRLMEVINMELEDVRKQYVSETVRLIRLKNKYNTKKTNVIDVLDKAIELW